MRIKRLVKILLEESPNFIKREELSKRMNLSESTIKNVIKDAKDLGHEAGFEIELQKGQGYVLHVKDEETLQAVLSLEDSSNYDVYDRKQRMEMLLFYLLQADGFISVKQLEDKMLLSRSTILRELESVSEELKKFNLKLEKQPYYGIIIQGEERDYRKAFSKFVLGTSYYLEPVKEYKDFIEQLELEYLRVVLRQALDEIQLPITDVAFDNIVTHLSILLFRVSQQNFITKNPFSATEIDEVYVQVAEFIVNKFAQHYGFSFPDSEIQYLAAHISGKSITTNFDSGEKVFLLKEIVEILNQLDKEFSTNFQEDSELQEALLLHMFPLIKRLYFNLQLENPLIEEIYTKYTNVFVVSYRFAALIEAKYDLTLSRDEIGYLALHFAAHFERLKNMSMERVKRIVVVCTTGGGSAHLLRLKLENIFSNAIITTIPTQDISKFDRELPDLYLSTVPIGNEYKGIPIIHIKHFLDEEEMRRIKETVYLQSNEPRNEYQAMNLKSLFYENLFQVNSKGDYLNILKESSNKMIVYGFAADDFTELVLEREMRFSTIYQNGVAGPHAMKLNAKVDSVSVTILEKAIEWQGRQVQIIFLINLKQGHLFLHKEISRLLLHIIDNKLIRERVLRAQSFGQFMNEISKIM